MSVQMKVKKLVNPERKKKICRANPKQKRSERPKRKAHRTANPLMTIGLLNPTRKTMKKTSEKHGKKPKGARKHNPWPFSKSAVPPKPQHHKKHKRNPSSIISGPISVFKAAGLAGVGLIATRQLPQLLLGTRNTGWPGYLANAGAAALTALGVGKAFGPANGWMVLIGGTMYLMNRFIAEKLSPIATFLSLSGLGDPTAAGGKLGGIRAGYFIVPTRYDKSGQPVIPRAIIDAARAAMPQPAASAAPAPLAGVSRLASRF